MKTPRLGRLVPETSGFNRTRIAIAAAVVVVTLGLVTFILTRSPSQPPREREPVSLRPGGAEPTELLEEDGPRESPPEPSAPPIFEPDLGRLFEEERLRPPVAPEILAPIASPRVQRAFSRPMSPLGRRNAPTSRDERAAGGSGLETMFEELEAQSEELRQLLEETPALAAASELEAPTPPVPALRETPVATAVLSSPAPWVLQQGTVIPAQLISEINSDLPGQVLAQVLRDVYDSRTFERVLVPRGTKLVGRYDSGLRTGQNRLALEWTRLILPGGSALEVEALPAVDRQGRSGLKDRVNHHTGRVFGNALLLSLVSAGFAAAQPTGDSVRLSAGDLAVEGASRELERAASELLRQGARIAPTVRIRAGRSLHVMLLRDLSFSSPYPNN